MTYGVRLSPQLPISVLNVEWEECGPGMFSLRPKHGGPSEPD